jgi:neutral amino acid transport system permease protein
VNHHHTGGPSVRWFHRTAAVLLGALAALLIVTTSPAAAEGETISGTLRIQQTREPAEGVTVSVTDAAGTEVGTAKSDEDGRFTIALPKAGKYTVKIDTDSLPNGIELGKGVQKERTITIQPSQQAGVAFALSNGKAIERDVDIEWVQRFVEGLRFGLIIAITAVGLSLIFGTTGLTNFAHGEMVTFGAFAGLFFNLTFDVPLWIAAIAAIIVGVAFGALNDLALWRPLRRRGTGLIAMLVVSIGLGLAMRFLLQLVVGGDTQSYSVPSERAVDMGPFSITPRDIIAMAICLVVLVGIAVMLQRTKIGKAMRAVADNRDLAASSGINVDRVILTVWMLGGGLAALGGVIYGWTINLRFDMGFTLLLLMFAGVTLGGLGTAYGALLGSLIIGVIVQMSTIILPDDIKNVTGLFVLILILLVRPSGILGARQRIG